MYIAFKQWKQIMYETRASLRAIKVVHTLKVEEPQNSSVIRTVALKIQGGICQFKLTDEIVNDTKIWSIFLQICSRHN